MERKLLAIFVIAVIVGAVLSYQIVESQFQRQLEEREIRISQLENSMAEIRAVEEEKKETVGAVVAASGEEVNCLTCHDNLQTKSFHVAQTIMKIDEASDKRRRTCIDCHGPLGPPWSADKQLTPHSEISFDQSIGLNGLLVIPSKIPHAIHKGKLDAGVIKCQSCHGEETEMIMPKADTGSGQVLVCQNCKYHPEGGNYITIHLELAGKKCTTCHTGGVIQVHQEKTKTLGQV